MTNELWMLLLSLATFFILITSQGMVSLWLYKLKDLAGPRDNLPEVNSILPGRLKRAVKNSIESLVLFVPLVLIAHVLNISTELTLLAAQIYFYSRIIHSVTYLAGIPWIRTLAFAGSTSAIVIMFIEIISV